MKAIQLLINTASKEELEKIISALFEQKLIACADVFPVESRYFWKGKIEVENRHQAIAFSLEDKRDSIIELVEKLHSDEVPGIIFSPVEANEEYLNWIKDSLK